MIKVKFDYTDDGKSLILTVKGHSNYDVKGRDTVCASATMLAYTIAQIVQDMYDRKELKKKPTIRLEEGDSVITCKPRRDMYAEALHSFFVVEVGFALLAHNYPEYVQLTPFGDGK